MKLKKDKGGRLLVAVMVKEQKKGKDYERRMDGLKKRK